MSGIVGPRLIPTPPTFADTKSFQFDGATDFITYADNSNLSFGDSVNDSPFSISAWIKFDNTGSRQGIVSKFSATNNCEYGLFLESNNTLKVYLFDGASTNIRGKASTVMTTGVWNYVTFTYDGQGGSTAYNGMKIYLNGVDISSSNVTLNTYTAMHNMSAPLKIGEYFGNYASGNLDEISIFNTELSQSEVLSIFNGGLPDSLTAFNPLLWLRMGEEATWNGSEFVLDNQGSIGGTATSVGILPTDPNPTTDVPLFDNKSFTYDGVSDAVVIGTTSLGITNAISVSAWVKIPTTNTGGGGTNIQEIICEDTTSSGQRNWALFWRGGGIDSFYFVIHNTNLSSASAQSVGVTPNSGQWIHILATYDGTANTNGIKLYIDGVLNAQGTASSTGINSFTSSEPNIGRLTGQNQWNFEGDINDVSVFDNDQSANASTIFNGGVANNISTLSPLGYWRAEQVTFDGTDWTLIDQGSGANNGTSVSMPLTSRTSDVPLFDNKSFAYDGIADYVDCGDIAEFKSATVMTLNCWVKFNTLGTTDTIMSKWDYSTQGCITVAIDNSSSDELIIFVANKLTDLGSNRTTTTNANLTTGVWQMISIIYDGSQANIDRVKVYVNGSIKTTTTNGIIVTSLTTATSSFKIGKWGGGLTRYIDGLVSEVSFFNTALSQANVTEIYNGGIANDISNLNPLSYWRSEFANWDGSNWTMIDQGSGANNGTSVSMPLTSRTSDVPT